MKRDYEGIIDGIVAGWLAFLTFKLFIYICIGTWHLIKYIYDNREVIADNIKSFVLRCVETCRKLYGKLKEFRTQEKLSEPLE